MKKNHFMKQDFKKIKFFKLKFPKLSNEEHELINIWCDIMGYVFEYDTEKGKAIISNPNNPERTKIAYLQKKHNHFRLVFNNRFEDISGVLAITRVLKLLTPANANKNLIKFVLSSEELEYVKEPKSTYSTRRNDLCSGSDSDYGKTGIQGCIDESGHQNDLHV